MFDICRCITTDCFFFGRCRLALCVCAPMSCFPTINFSLFPQQWQDYENPLVRKCFYQPHQVKGWGNKLLEDTVPSLAAKRHSEKMKALMAALLPAHLDTIVENDHYLKAKSAFNTAIPSRNMANWKHWAPFLWVEDLQWFGADSWFVFVRSWPFSDSSFDAGLFNSSVSAWASWDPPGQTGALFHSHRKPAFKKKSSF